MLAMAAVLASAAQAATEFQAESYPGMLTGTGPGAGIANAFTITTGKGKSISNICKENRFESELPTAGATTLTVKAHYASCKLAGLVSTVDMNTCAFVLHLVDKSEPLTATADLMCTKAGGDTITITQGTCVVHVEEQQGLNHVIFDSIGVGTTKELKATVHIENIKYEITNGCANTTGNTTTTDGKYTEEILITGETIPPFQHIGIFIG
jgi:hypothetical protein